MRADDLSENDIISFNGADYYGNWRVTGIHRNISEIFLESCMPAKTVIRKSFSNLENSEFQLIVK